jgi:alpha-galactosidase
MNIKPVSVAAAEPHRLKKFQAVHWNDPDRLEIGDDGMTGTEDQTHMTLWSLLAAPLISGNDLANMPKTIHDILTNHEIIAIDQDSLGKETTRASIEGSTEIWFRELAAGARGIPLFNRGTGPAEMRLNFTSTGITNRVNVRDVWAAKDLGALSGEYRSTVPPHGVVLLRTAW